MSTHQSISINCEHFVPISKDSLHSLEPFNCQSMAFTLLSSCVHEKADKLKLNAEIRHLSKSLHFGTLFIEFWKHKRAFHDLVHN